MASAITCSRSDSAEQGPSTPKPGKAATLHPKTVTFVTGAKSDFSKRRRHPRSWYAKGLRCRACASLRRNCYANPNRWLEHGFAGSNPTCPATQSVSASATQAWRSDERLISRNHRARWRHRKVQRCTVGYQRGLAGRRGSGTTPHGSGPLLSRVPAKGVLNDGVKGQIFKNSRSVVACKYLDGRCAARRTRDFVSASLARKEVHHCDLGSATVAASKGAAAASTGLPQSKRFPVCS